MALFNKTVVNIKCGDNVEVIKLLKEIKSLLKNDDGKLIQEIIDILYKAILDIKSTV